MIDITHDSITSAKLTELKCQSLLDRSETIESVEKLGLALTSCDCWQQIVSEKQVLGSFKKTVLADFFDIDIFFLETIFSFSFEWWWEDSQEFDLILSKVSLRSLSVHFEELWFDVAMLKLLILNLRKGLQSQVSIGDIVDVQNLKDAAGALI